MKYREFKKLKCHYLTAENWKVCPIVRRHNRGTVARMYHIEPHFRWLAL